MTKVLSSRLQHSLCPFTMLFVEAHSKLDFSDIYLIPFFGDASFGNTLAMTVIFFLKMLKYSCIFWK